MGSSEYLLKVQNLLNAETAGISQPQTLAQKLRYELQAQEVGTDEHTHSQRQQAPLAPLRLDVTRTSLTCLHVVFPCANLG